MRAGSRARVEPEVSAVVAACDVQVREAGQDHAASVEVASPVGRGQVRVVGGDAARFDSAGVGVELEVAHVARFVGAARSPTRTSSSVWLLYRTAAGLSVQSTSRPGWVGGRSSGVRSGLVSSRVSFRAEFMPNYCACARRGGRIFSRRGQGVCVVMRIRSAQKKASTLCRSGPGRKNPLFQVGGCRLPRLPWTRPPDNGVSVLLT